MSSSQIPVEIELNVNYTRIEVYNGGNSYLYFVIVYSARGSLTHRNTEH